MNQLTAIGVALMACATLQAGATEAKQAPNIIFFLVDDMGLMDTSVPMLTDENGKPQRHPLKDWIHPHLNNGGANKPIAEKK